MSFPILVIGALGNVGEEVVNELLKKGKAVRAADIDVEKIKAKFGSAVEAVHFDFSKQETYKNSFIGVEKMFLMRPPQISDVKRYMFPAIDAAKCAGVKHVIFLSLIGIEKTKFVPHYKVEQYLKEVNLQTTLLRASFFMQNLNTTHRIEIKERNEIFIPVGNAKTSFIDVRDIAAVAALALTQDGHVGKNYDLTGHEALDYWQVSKTLSEVLGREIKYKNPNLIYFFISILQRGTPFMFALVQTGLYASTRFGMAKTITNEVEKLTGKQPISFKQYANDYKQSWILETI
jgi:uncharacterized protein YbjT (DUF2867 family)